MNDSERLRNNRLVFYEKDIEKITTVLAELVNMSRSKCAFMIDKEGHLVAREGSVRTFDTDSLSALVAGSFAATAEMARLLGESEFSVMFHQGQVDNIQLTLIGNRTILVVIFDDQTQLGMVRLYTAEAVKKIHDVLEASDEDGEVDLGLSGDFEAIGKANLDSVFE